MPIAVTREVSPGIDRCELTHLSRQPIDLVTARAQHAAYEQCLREAGCAVVRLPSDASLPDSVFVEDVAVVFDEFAVMMRPGVPSRRAETSAIAGAIRAFRPLRYIEPPGTIDGGDVLVIGKRVVIGRSGRTNDAAISQMERLLAPIGYLVQSVRVQGCLHLKSAVTAVSEDTLLVNRSCVMGGGFSSFTMIDVDSAEPFGANALRVGDRVIYPTRFSGTRRRLEDRGVHVIGVDVGELAKAEGGVTCCSLILSVGNDVRGASR